METDKAVCPYRHWRLTDDALACLPGTVFDSDSRHRKSVVKSQTRCIIPEWARLPTPRHESNQIGRTTLQPGNLPIPFDICSSFGLPYAYF